MINCQILIAEVAVPKRFEPGETVVEAGALPNRLLVVANGSVQGDSRAETDSEISIIGVDALALERSFEETFVAGPDGATCLMISKGHFFTIINECPAILTGHLHHTGGRKP